MDQPPAGDVTIDAEAVLVREFLGVGSPELTSAAAQRIRSLQQPDGSWSSAAWPGRAGDLSASVLAYLVLRLAGDSPDAYHLAVGAGWIRDAGGSAAAGLVTRAWLASFGLTGWANAGVPAPEGIYLSGRPGISDQDADGESYGRVAAVSLSIIGTLRPARPLPFTLPELSPGGLAEAARGGRTRILPLSVTQRAALRRCGQWLISWHQRAGLPAGRRPVWPGSLVALHLLGYPLRQPVLSEGLAWLDSVTVRPRPVARPGDAAFGAAAAGPARLAADRQPPVRDTALAVLALAEAGLPADHQALVSAGSWLLAQRIEGPAAGGPQPGPPPSGWSFGRDDYPVAADTATVLLALSRIDVADRTAEPAMRHALRWLSGAQARDGSWGGSAVQTALVVHALARYGAPDPSALRHGVVWLLRAQRPDGAWPGWPGPADLRATALTLPALVAAGVLPGKHAIRTAVEWLLDCQNMDAGWAGGVFGPAGEDRASRNDGTNRGARRPAHGGPAREPERHGRSDADSTALALGALLAADGAEIADPADLAADWLVRAQQNDGGWSARARSAGAGSGSRGRAALLPGLLAPLAALGRYAAAAGTGVADTGLTQTGLTQTGLTQTGLTQTGLTETGPADIGLTDMGAPDIGSLETGRAETGRAETGRAETRLAETGPGGQVQATRE